MNTPDPCPAIESSLLESLFEKFQMPDDDAKKVKPANSFEWNFIATIFKEGWQQGAGSGSRHAPYRYNEVSALELFARFAWTDAFDKARAIKLELAQKEKVKTGR